jgi:hypothetical protein
MKLQNLLLKKISQNGRKNYNRNCRLEEYLA